MAGHSQFKNIMYRKGAQDAKKARAFAKIIREIMVSAKMSPDPNSNPRLRAALASARAANMPKDNVDRAIKKAIGNDADSNFTEVRYEGYGPSGVAIIVETLTDNRNRTASEIRAAFSKHGGSLGETNSVAFSFEHCGYLRFSKDKDFDTIFENAIDVGAENVEATDEGIEVTCAVSDFAAVRDGLVDKIGDADESNLIWRPNNMAPINDFDSAKTLIKLIDILEDNDDVQNVYSNVDIATDVLAKLENG